MKKYFLYIVLCLLCISLMGCNNKPSNIREDVWGIGIVEFQKIDNQFNNQSITNDDCIKFGESISKWDDLNNDENEFLIIIQTMELDVMQYQILNKYEIKDEKLQLEYLKDYNINKDKLVELYDLK